MNSSKMRRVNSSNIDSVGYESDCLYIKFNNGKAYRYEGVPKALYESLLVSESKGRFVNMNVKGKYNYSFAEVEDK